MTFHPIPPHQKRQLATLRAAYRRIRRQKYSEVIDLDATWTAALADLEAAPPGEKQNVLAATARTLLAMDQTPPIPPSTSGSEEVTS